ncbi:MAG: LysR family transcriptional regulator [Deltaproteobacteria bacterium]|nr:LysR family transcriptional regulator [Deltaproteobacteria bacterium]
MTLHQLKIWTTVAKRQSMTKAAAELRIRQPSVTQQIKLLEKEYRIRLYTVNGRGIELSQAGKRLLSYAKKILQHVDNLERTLKGVKNGQSLKSRKSARRHR